MTLDSLIMLAGAFILLEPHLGFPNTWDVWLMSLGGVFIVGLGIAVRRRGLKDRPQNVPTSEAESAHA